MRCQNFDRFGFYKGPLPRECGHTHTQKLIGKTAAGWKTGPSAAYPPQLCEFLAGLILAASAASGGGDKSKPDRKRSSPVGDRKQLREHQPQKSRRTSAESAGNTTVEQAAEEISVHSSEEGGSPTHQSQDVVDAGSSQLDSGFNMSLCMNSW